MNYNVQGLAKKKDNTGVNQEKWRKKSDKEENPKREEKYQDKENRKRKRFEADAEKIKEIMIKEENKE